MIEAGRLKYFEMLQSIISRMATNSFLIKGWCITLTSAILAIAMKDGLHNLIIVSYIPVVMFWMLDAFFLRQERLFRGLWNLKIKEDQSHPVTFSMDTSCVKDVSCWFGVMCSKTLLIFYLSLLSILIIMTVFFVIKR